MLVSTLTLSFNAFSRLMIEMPQRKKKHRSDGISKSGKIPFE